VHAPELTQTTSAWPHRDRGLGGHSPRGSIPASIWPEISTPYGPAILSRTPTQPTLHR
jgi:hypothetical protein